MSAACRARDGRRTALLRRLARAALALALAATPSRARAQCLEFPPPGLGGDVYALARFDGALYAGGDFEAAGASAAARIARWREGAWSALDEHGLAGGAQVLVATLCAFDDGAGPALWVGGAFESAGGHPAGSIARFDGAQWTPLGLGAGFDDAVLALCAHDPDGEGGEPPTLWAGGAFRSAGGERASGLARWDARAGRWRAALERGPAGVDGVVHALASHAGELVLGGRFTRAGTSAAANLARFDGLRFAPLGATRAAPAGGTDGPVQALASFDAGEGAALVVGGAFTRAGEAECAAIARLTSAGFAPLGGGLGPVGRARRAPRVFGLSVDRGPDGRARLLVAGRYGSAGEHEVEALALASGLEPEPVDPGDPGELPGESLRSRRQLLASWDGGEWSALGVLGDDARAIVSADGELLVAGRFQTAGRAGASRIARRDEQLGTLTALCGGSGLGGGARALLAHDFGRALEGVPAGPTLVAAGDFRAAGTELAPGIAVWSGGAWRALGAGTDGAVNALVSFDGALVAAGAFSAAGTVRARAVARFDGTRWSALGAGLGDEALAAVVFQGSLVVGGAFLTAGGEAAAHVARWDGRAWTPMGAGLDGLVRALVVHDDGEGAALYAGGDFELSGEETTRHVARWDGTAWRPLGLGVDAPVHALASFDDGEGPSLVAGGELSRAGSARAAHLARWRSGRWGAFESGRPGDDGLDGIVRALAVQGSGPTASLWIGGDFERAGALACAHVARWREGAFLPATRPGGGVDRAVHALASFDGTVVAGGDFARLDGERASAHVVGLACPATSADEEDER